MNSITAKHIGLVGIDSSHAEDFIRHFNLEARYPQMRINALWGPQATDDRYRQLSAMAPGLKTMNTLADLVGAVDAVIVGDRDGSLHASHALPAIAAGKAVFIDKPLANCLADAKAIIDAAQEANVPLLSGSALRWATDTQCFKAQLNDIAGPLSVEASGSWYPESAYGGAIFYAIHTVELMLEVLGTSWTGLTLAPGSQTVLQCRFGDAAASLRFAPPKSDGRAAFGVSVTAGDARIERAIELSADYMVPVVDRIAAMLLSGKSGMSPTELLAPIGLMEEINALLGTEQA